MIDPLSALGVAGNVLQVIDFGFQLVADGNQIYHSSTGALEEDRAADELAKDLEGLTKRLAESQNDWTKSHGNLPLEPDEVHLRNVCERCTEIAIELQRQLHKLRRHDGGKRRRLQSYKQALISVWRKDHIDAIATRLARYQQELDTHILIGIRKNVRESEWKNSEHFASLERQTQQLTVAVLEGDDRVDSRLNDQAEVLIRIYEQTSRILSSLEESKKPTPPPPPHATRPDCLAVPLHEAARAGELLKVKQLLRSSTTDINVRDENGCTALHLASTAEVAKKLLARTVNKAAEDNEGRTALHCAVLKRRLEVIKALLEGGLDSSIEDDMGKTAIFYAQDCPAALWLLTYGPEPNVQAEDHLNNTGLLQMAWLGDIEGVRFFLQLGGNVNTQNAWEETALTEASRHGSLEIVDILSKAGANLELAADRQWTPLLQAVRDNRTEVVQLLLRHGASKEAKLKNGNAPLAEACFRGHFEIAEMLVRSGCDVEVVDHFNQSPLKLAVSASRIGLIEMLLKRGVNVDLRDHDGFTALWSAAKMGHTEALKILLEGGANPNTKSAAGFTALGAACFASHYDCASLLLGHGAEVNTYAKPEYGGTPLAAAAQLGDTGMIELLIDHGANIEICTQTGLSALSLAASYGRYAAISLLIEGGADLEHRGFTNQDPELDKTPLMRAAIGGWDSSVLLLLDLGADVGAKDIHGTTALYYAAVAGHSEVVRRLVQRDADVNIQTKGGATALMGAAGTGHVEIVRQLLEANANTRLRDWRGCTAWNLAVSENYDRELEHLLKPGPEENETLRQLQTDRSPSEIATYMHEVYP